MYSKLWLEVQGMYYCEHPKLPSKLQFNILCLGDSNSPSADLNESELFPFELLLLSEVSSELVTLAAVFLNLYKVIY